MKYTIEAIENAKTGMKWSDIEAAYKEERKILLKNLSGSSAFKDGQKKGFSQDDLDKAKANPVVRAEIKAILGGNDDEQ